MMTNAELVEHLQTHHKVTGVQGIQTLHRNLHREFGIWQAVVHGHAHEPDMASDEEHFGEPVLHPNARVERNAALLVTFRGGEKGFFPIPPDGGWALRLLDQQIVVGRGMPRTHIPLANVLSYDVVDLNQ